VSSVRYGQGYGKRTEEEDWSLFERILGSYCWHPSPLSGVLDGDGSETALGSRGPPSSRTRATARCQDNSQGDQTATNMTECLSLYRYYLMEMAEEGKGSRSLVAPGFWGARLGPLGRRDFCLLWKGRGGGRGGFFCSV
jgi:hypothetical protein